ncbi:MAG: formate dehydrogenase accessory sulfurtransferase FdhD [Saprospiraceae bacterium]
MNEKHQQTSISIKHQNILRFTEEQSAPMVDIVTQESPLEINVTAGSGVNRKKETIAITMRTPGEDAHLALGFLFSEGLINTYDDILKIEDPATTQGLGEDQTVHLYLRPDVWLDKKSLERHFYTSSSCGVCGKVALDLVRQQIGYVLPEAHPKIRIKSLYHWPDQMRKDQSVFSQTGSIHAAGLFSSQGQLLACCEDVGRHNALDKLIGAALKKQALPWSNNILLLSGRISFELVQKALMAGVPIIAAVGAPSSLAIDLADAHGMTLVGFLKKNTCNVYCGAQRLLSD